MSELADSYAQCEAITRKQAANFYYGIRLLSPERRRALCAAYAFARRVDDIGDGNLPAGEKLRLLEQTDVALAAMHTPGAVGVDPVLIALADADRRFQLPPGALGELIEGVRMDVLGTSYDTFDELVGYCRRVAGAIGRVCLAIFDSRELSRDSPSALAHADDLGVALQLTNILRDVREDAENGRVYIPGEDLRRFGLAGGTPAAELPDRLAALAHERSRLPARENGSAPDAQIEALCSLVRFEADRAESWFARGMALVPLLDRRSAACVRAMAGIYHRLLRRIEAEPGRVLRERVSLPAREKMWVAMRALAGAPS
jgi:phytoene synthase